jgi:hypothetical protein
MTGLRLFALVCLVGGCLVAFTGCDDETTNDSGSDTTSEQSPDTNDDATAERKREKAREKKAAKKRAKAKARKRAKARERERQRELEEAQAPPPEPEPEETEPAGDCEPGYDPCVPSYPPDLDCPDLDGPYSVSGSDPHGLDRDGDGTGCE